ncbi:hypothetical protein ACP70R_043132 [Stipagrostis hirtigluma subsp. patula]
MAPPRSPSPERARSLVLRAAASNGFSVAPSAPAEPVRPAASVTAATSTPAKAHALERFSV